MIHRLSGALELALGAWRRDLRAQRVGVGTRYADATRTTAIRAPGAVVLALAVQTALAGCAMSGVTSAATAPIAHGHRECPAASLAQVVAQVNAARRRAGVKPLTRDVRLERTARARSAAMASSGGLSHHGWERALREAGVNGRVLGENVAWNYPSAAAVMTGWLASAGHRANILNPRFREIGVGCVIDTGGQRWWTQDFEG